MRLPLRISVYFGRIFLQNFLIVLAAVSSIIILVESLEILRRSFSKEVPFSIIIEMVLLKSPQNIEKLIPFIVLISGVLTFSKLTKNQELIVARAAGISAWQFLASTVVFSLILGIFLITVFNPLSCAMYGRYEKIENRYLYERSNLIEISASGLWLRQSNYDGKIGETIIHALRATDDLRLKEVVIFIFDGNDQFVKRIDAKSASLDKKRWRLTNVILTEKNSSSKRIPEYYLDTDLTLGQIQESFASPETISFWQLPGFIKTITEAGFSALKHKMHFSSTLASPFIIASMVFIAAAFSLHNPRNARVPFLIAGSVVTGFVIYFVTDLVSALGVSGNIPVSLAAWAPVGINIFIGTALMLHFEEG